MSVSHRSFSLFLTAVIVTFVISAAVTFDQPISSGLDTREAVAAGDDQTTPLPALKETKAEIDKRYRNLAGTANLELRKRPSQKELLALVARQPGGTAKIDLATVEKRTLLRGKLRRTPFSVELTPETPMLETPYAHYTLYGSLGGRGRSCEISESLAEYVFPFGTVMKKPNVSFFVEIPRTEWYVLNFECSAKVWLKTELLHQGSTSAGLVHYFSVGSWEFEEVEEHVNCASLLFLEAGLHCFHLMVHESKYSTHFYGVTINEYGPIETEYH